MNKSQEPKSVFFEMGEFVDNETEESLLVLFPPDNKSEKKDKELINKKRQREKEESESESESEKEKSESKERNNKKKKKKKSHRHHHHHKHSKSKQKKLKQKEKIKMDEIVQNKENENKIEQYENIINQIDNIDLKNNNEINQDIKNKKEQDKKNSNNDYIDINEIKQENKKKLFNIDKAEYDFSNLTFKDIHWLPVNNNEKLNNTNLFYSNPDNCKLSHREIYLPKDFPKEAKPIDYLNLFYTDELWNHIVDQTNKFAEAKIDSYDINLEDDVNRQEEIPNFKDMPQTVQTKYILTQSKGVKNKIYKKIDKKIKNPNKNNNSENINNDLIDNKEKTKEEYDTIDYIDEDFVAHDDKGNIMEEIDIPENNSNLSLNYHSQSQPQPQIKYKRGKKKGPITPRQKYLEEKNNEINNEDILITNESYIENDQNSNTEIISNDSLIENNINNIIPQKEMKFYNYSRWKYTTKEEIKLFHGLILWMGIHSNKDYKDNWSNDYIYSSNISKFMSRNRFMMLNTFLHLDDIKKEQKADKIFKVRYVLNYLNNIFNKLYKPSKFICIDECMIKLCSTNEYKETLFRKKNEHQGIKALLLCDNYTYYCMEMVLDTGKNNEYRMINDKLITNRDNLTNNENIIISLLRNITKLNSKHILYMDAKYTSYKICEYCRLNNIGLIGLIKREKVNIKDEDFPTIKSNDENITSLKQKYAFFIDSKKNMTLTIIRDSNNYECLLSNVTIPCLIKMDKNNCLKKNIKNKSKNKNIISKKFIDLIEIPNLVKNYSERVKSVVLCNIRTKTYHYPHKNFKWWKSVYYHIFHLCINNAYALYKINNGKMLFKEFYYNIVKSLIGDEPKSKKNKVHALVYINPQLKSKRRLYCRYCKKKKTEYMCPDCSTPNSTAALCVIDCFKKFHENGGKPASDNLMYYNSGNNGINNNININNNNKDMNGIKMENNINENIEAK